VLPSALAWATVVIGASLLTALGFFGFITLPAWLIVVGVWLVVRDRTATAGPDTGWRAAKPDPELASYLRIEERELEAVG
jgi:hypothetical protein